MASELAQRIKKTVDDEGYYDMEAASEAVDRLVLQEVRFVLQGLQPSIIDMGETVEAHWCNPTGVNCNNVCERARALMAQLEVK